MNSIKTKPLNLQESEKLCETLAKHIREGDVFSLTGDLGAGKTTLVANITKHLDVKPGTLITSPTYVIHHIYEAKFPIHHIDFYRLEHLAQTELGFEEFLGKRGVTFIEWFEKFPQVWTGPLIQIQISIPDLEHRVYSFTASNAGENQQKMLEDIKKCGSL